VKAKNKRRELAILLSAQLTDNLDFGATGALAARLVALDPGAGRGNVTALLLKMVASPALATLRRMKTATPMIVLELVIGANGSPGPPVIRPVTLAGKLDRGSVTVHHLHLGDLIARATNRKRLPVTLNSAQ